MPNSEGWGHAVTMSELNEYQTTFAITLPVITTNNRIKYMNSTNTSRTEHLFVLMKKSDDAFNSRDVAGMNKTHITQI
jgi:hypothetical protein